MLRAVLARQGRVHAAEKSFNNHWGVPLTLARMPRDADFAVIEIGMNHPGEIAPLARLARPACGDDHHGRGRASGGVRRASTGIAREKATIFDGLEPRRHRAWSTAICRHRPSLMVAAARADAATVADRSAQGEGATYRLDRGRR